MRARAKLSRKKKKPRDTRGTIPVSKRTFRNVSVVSRSTWSEIVKTSSHPLEGSLNLEIKFRLEISRLSPLGIEIKHLQTRFYLAPRGALCFQRFSITPSSNFRRMGSRGGVSICVTFRARFEKDKEFYRMCVVLGGIDKSAFGECVKRPTLLVGIINALSRPCDELDSLEHSLHEDC